MRLLLAVGALALLLLLPATSQADRPQPTPQSDEGCLVVDNGQGTITIAAKGGIFGRFDTGQVVIDDLTAGDTKGPKVFGAEDVQSLSDTRTKYAGDNVRFRFTGGGQFRVTVTAIGIELSAIGHGYAILSGRDFFDSGTYSADADSLCAKNFKSLPKTPTRVQLGASAPG